VKKTMQVAQRLYEGIELGPDGSVGLITYMRTDSTRISADALTDVRARITETYGEEYVPEKPNVYRSKKDAQDATRRSVRPTSTADPESIKRFLGKDELKLYGLIWNRFVASQMKPAVYDEIVVDIGATPKGGGPSYLLRAKGSTLKFKGFLAVYEEAKDEKREEKPKADKTGAPRRRSPMPRDGAPSPHRGRGPGPPEARHGINTSLSPRRGSARRAS